MYHYPSPVSSSAFRNEYSAGPSSARFSPKPFIYNGRVALALLPSLAVLASYGGSHVAAALVVGFMGAYILDGMRFKEGAFFAVWGTLGVAHLAVVHNTIFMNELDLPLTLSILSLAMCALTLFLTGVWATLQFKWVQMQHPAVAVAFEKTLILGCIPVCGTMQAWGVTLTSGIESTPFFLACLLCMLYSLFALPLPSSFTTSVSRRIAIGGGGGGGKSSGSRGNTMQSRPDAIVAFIITVVLPASVYAAVHSVNLFQWVHLWSLLLLGSGPLLFTSAIRDGLWWLGTSSAASAVQNLFVLLSVGGLLAGIEGRIIFYSFGQYIRLAAPWSYIAITLALYGGGALTALYISGALDEETATAFIGPVAMISASVGGLVMGLPIWVLPAPLVAAAGFSLFFESRLLRDYLIFAAGAVATGVWFLWKHFWFLQDIQLDGMPLRTLCILLAVAMLPGFILPGLFHAGAKNSLVAVPLLVQAALLCIIEEHLFAGDHTEVTYNMHPMFPAFLVIGTSAAGLALARRLQSMLIISSVESYLLQCGYAAKLAMLVVPEAKLILPVLGVALTVTPPLLINTEEQSSSSSRGGERLSGGATNSGGPRRRSQLLPWQGIGLASAVVLAVVAARYAIFDLLHLLFNRRPSEALATGALLILAALGCIPLVSRYYKTSAQAKRVLLLTTAAGLLLVLLRPPLPVSGGAECPHLPFGLCPRIWNERHAPQHEEDDVSIYGDGLRRREHWPLWLLLSAAFAGLVAATSPAPARQVAPLRLGEAALAAALVGGYMSLEFFPGMVLLQVLTAASALVVAVVVVLLQVPSRNLEMLLRFLIMTWCVCFNCVILATLFVSSLPPLPPEARRLLPDISESIEFEEERMLAVQTSVFAVLAAESLLLAFSMKLRVAAVGSGLLPASASAAATGGGGRRVGAVGGGFAAAGGLSAVDRAAEFLGQCIPMFALQPGAAKAFINTGFTTAAMQRLQAEGLHWVPELSNLITLMCFGSCIYLNALLTEGNPLGMLLVAPVLLLLSQDGAFCRGLTEERRYFPPTAAASALLLVSVVWRVGDSVFGEDAYFEMMSVEGWDLVKNSILAVACIPTLYDVLHFMWHRHKVGPVRALLPAAVASLGIYFGDFEEVKLLGGMCVVGGVFLAASGHVTRRAGRRLI